MVKKSMGHMQRGAAVKNLKDYVNKEFGLLFGVIVSS